MKFLMLFAMMWLTMSAQANYYFPPDFFFGIANAPAHVEDNLSDIWIDFANKGGVAAYHNQTSPERRLDFWSNPQVELDLAQELGVKVFRMGIDWQRLQPRPGQALDVDALNRYRQILKMVKARGMKVMLTLFHHSEPRWTLNRGSWRDRDMVNDFQYFAREAMEYLGKDVDYLVTFNEAQVYVMLSQVAGIWPSNRQSRQMGFIDIGPFKGSYTRSLKNIARAHKQFYAWMKAKFPNIPVGIAHNTSYHKGSSFISNMSAAFTRKRMNYYLPDLLKDHLDYLGVNYYGIEVVKGLGVAISPNYEYSDSGRGVSPNGFYLTLKQMHERYKLPMIITENGVADSSDWLRPSYLAEHLVALKKAMNEGADVKGYIHWTLSDNWEWADGYCPKFGLVAVDRNDNLKRIKRDSYYFYQEIIKNHGVSAKQRASAWKLVEQSFGKEREFCRSDDGISSLDEPILLPIKPIDWRISY